MWGHQKYFMLEALHLAILNPKKTYLNFRNSLYTLTKNAKGNLFILILVRLLLDGIAGIKFLVELKFRHIIAIIHAHISFYKHLGVLLKQRKAFKDKRKYYKKTSIVLNYYVYKNKLYKSL